MKKIYLIILSAIGLQAHAQNVGIGISPATRAKLEVEGIVGSGATSAVFGTNSAGISFQRNWPTIGFNQYRDDVAPGSQGKYLSSGYAAIQFMDPGSGIYVFDMFGSGGANSFTPAGVRGITVAPNGNTGIRTDYLNASLVVARGQGFDGTAVFAGPEQWSHFNYSSNEDTYIRAGKSGGTVFINKGANGSVLVGTTSAHIGINSGDPFFTIEVHQPDGQKAFTLVDVNNYRWAMAVNFINTSSNGTGVVIDFYYNNMGKGRFQYWNGAYIILSDRRLKKDIEPMEPVLEKVKKLRPVRYEMNRNNPNHDKDIGMVAQEVKPLFPLMVRQIKDENLNGKSVTDALVMDYSSFGVIAIKALQEQYKQLQLLEKEKQALLNRLEMLEKALGEF
jgi:hypothetical protein